MNVVNALNIYIIAMPTRIIIVELILLVDDITAMTAAGSSAKRNAFTIWAFVPSRKGIMQIPKTNETDIPRSAADDIPIVYGSVSGLRVILCITEPQIARMAPTQTPHIVRGALSLTTIWSIHHSE